MSKLITLELRRNRLRPYHTAALLCGVALLALQYLMAVIPHMDPVDPDAALFSDYLFLTGLTSLVCMAAFTILSAVLAARLVVEEYRGKRAILLLSYPVNRKKVLAAKLELVFGYTAAAMLLCGTAVQTVFALTEAVFPLCGAPLTAEAILCSLGFLLGCSFLAGLLGLLSLWMGLRKKSVPATIVTAVILACLACQTVSGAYFFRPVLGIALGLAAIFALLAVRSMARQVENMEV